jgi:hypothetical protein
VARGLDRNPWRQPAPTLKKAASGRSNNQEVRSEAAMSDTARKGRIVLKEDAD